MALNNSKSATDRYSLADLADPKKVLSPVQISSKYKVDKAISHLRLMLLIRRSEEEIARLVKEGKAKCPCHLTIGQEAIAVGVSDALNEKDRVFGGHRSHGHYLALGGDLKELFSEILGKVTGCSKGMGGSMHLSNQEKGFQASVPIVGATIPIATGAALALKFDAILKDKPGKIAVSYFGDGACEEGVFHESLNLASIQKLPILFVCENNLFSSHLDINLRQPFDRISRFAEVHGINFKTIDGNNVSTVTSAADELISSIRETGKPAFLEAVTYRWRGHVGPNEDIDVGIKRSEVDLKLWKKRDPIQALIEALLETKEVSVSEIEEIKAEVNSLVEVAIEFAESSPYPEPEQLYSSVRIQGDRA